MRPILLTYNLPAAHLSQLRRVCMRLSVTVRPVASREWEQPLASLLQSAAGQVASDLSVPAPQAVDMPPFQDAMLVMCGFSNPLMNSFLAAMRQARLPAVELKAVLTPTNSLWSSVELHTQLTAERDAIARGQRAVHS